MDKPLSWQKKVVDNENSIQQYVLYILESNAHSVFGHFLNGKKLVRGSNPHLSFNRPLPTGRLTE